MAFVCFSFFFYSLFFVLLARHVSNVAKRSMRDQCKNVSLILMTDQRPTDLLFGIRAAITATQRVIRSTSCLVLCIGFSGSAD